MKKSLYHSCRSSTKWDRQLKKTGGGGRASSDRESGDDKETAGMARKPLRRRRGERPETGTSGLERSLVERGDMTKGIAAI